MKDRVCRQDRQERSFRSKEQNIAIINERIEDAVARHTAKVSEGASPDVLSRLARRVRDLKAELKYWEMT